MQYEYRCDTCKTSLELFKNVSERNNCPKCTTCAHLMRRVITTPHVIYGEGFPGNDMKKAENETVGDYLKDHGVDCDCYDE